MITIVATISHAVHLSVNIIACNTLYMALITELIVIVIILTVSDL